MIKFSCNQCGLFYEIDDTGLDFECVSTSERQMGTEKEYSGRIEQSCDTCLNQMIIEFSFWEYPYNVLNYYEYNQEGCIVSEEPDYNSYIAQ